MEKITIAEAYEKAVAAIPGRANSKAWELCRDEMRRNLAVAFGAEPPFPVWKTRAQRVGQRVENASIQDRFDIIPTQSTT